MAWKVERWIAEVFPGEAHFYDEYRQLPARELAIVAAAVLDAALAELLFLRLRNQPECEEFLGLNGDGRAPAGSFGARIQLALLVGLIEPEDAAILRSVKELRNTFAHRVRVNFLSPTVQKTTLRLLQLWIKRSEKLNLSAGTPESRHQFRSSTEEGLKTHNEAGESLLLVILSVYQALFHRMLSKIVRLDDVLRSKMS